MENNNNYMLVFLLGFLITLSARGAAETPPSGLYVSPGLGYMFFANKNNLADSPALSLGLGYQFDHPWAVELVYFGATAKPKLPGNNDVDYQHARLDVLYHFPGSTALNSYLVAGVGEATYKFDILDIEKIQQTEINLGLGVLGFMSEHLALRGDIRTIFGTEDELGHVLFSIGLSYYFGSRDIKSVAEPDLDNDGVPDSIDECRTTPTGVKVDARGCALDTDGDGVADYNDKCANTPKGINVDEHGCPLDSDGDGVADDKDECPQTPAGAKVDAKGCPILLKETVEISMQLSFNLGSAEILPKHFEELAKAGNFMRQYPDTTVVIEGHTDSQGAAIFNEQLSLQRADSVRLYLIGAYDLDSSRISAKGFGESQAIADNGTPEGRAKNRRVVAVIKANVVKAEMVEEDAAKAKSSVKESSVKESDVKSKVRRELF